MRGQVAAAVLLAGLPGSRMDCTPLCPPPPPPAPEVRTYPPTVEGVTEFILASKANVRPKEAARIAGHIMRASKGKSFDPLLLAAIVRHESTFKRSVKACTTWGCDSGLGQINDVHITELALDPERLVHDDGYNLAVSALLLERALNADPTDERAWSRYHDNRAKQREAWERYVVPWVDMALATEKPAIAQLATRL